jgi:hypothetical protein
MADEIDVLLKKADLENFLNSFQTLGATKVSHFQDVDSEMMKEMGLKPLEIKRLNRIFETQFCKGAQDKILDSDTDHQEEPPHHLMNEAGPSGIQTTQLQPNLSTRVSSKAGPKQSGILIMYKRAYYFNISSGVYLGYIFNGVIH